MDGIGYMLLGLWIVITLYMIHQCINSMAAYATEAPGEKTVNKLEVEITSGITALLCILLASISLTHTLYFVFTLSR